MNLISFVGFISSGKDTACSLLENYGFQSFSFAESLKDAIASIFCWDRALLEGNTSESRIWREQIDTWWADRLGIPQLTPRWVMQNIGTDVFRNHFHNDIWILNIERKLTLLPKNANVVLKDSRFNNEINLARKFNGKSVRIKRGPEPEWFETARRANNGSQEDLKVMENLDIHFSEWAWIGQELDFTIENDSDILSLHKAVKEICL